MPDRKSDPKLSVESEPWLKPVGFKHDPSEYTYVPDEPDQPDVDRIRDSVHSEPFRDESGEYGEWLDGQQKRTTKFGNIMAALIAGLAAGPFAVIGAFITGQQTSMSIVYLCFFGPIIEELLKQSGMIYLVERKPYRIFSPWQVAMGAALGALVFAVIENIFYTGIYFSQLPKSDAAILSAFRWRVCTSLHVICGVIASLGISRVWRNQCKTHKPAQLSLAFPYFAVAMAVHGIYNLIAFLTESIWRT